jgi:hypothetical protein
MTATTIRLDASVKRALDEFQGYIQSETGERVSHGELVARLLRFVRRNEATFLASRDESEWVPPTVAQLDALLAKTKRVRVKTNVSKLDEELYGGGFP